MHEVTLDELISQLPKGSQRFPLIEGEPDLRYVHSSDPVFVAPKLTCTHLSDPPGSVILIEARAAVGKSTLAEYVAWATGSPLWNLSELHVGSGTAWGRLAKAFGPQTFAEVIAALAEGDLIFVVDALDEAELAAPGPSFDAFLDDVRQLFGGPPGHTKAIVFGRSETIDYVRLYFGTGHPVRHFRIEPFDREAANQLIENYLDSRASRTDPWNRSARTHRVRPSVFEKARDLLYQFFILAIAPDRDASWTSERVREFLGYTPVLVAVSEYLAEYADNFHRLVLELEGQIGQPGVASRSQWSLLAGLMRRLLEREQHKFQKQARDALTGDDPTLGDLDLYSPHEQVSFILGRPPRGHYDAILRHGLPPRENASYQELVKAAMPNHPFLGPRRGYANHVVRDYVHAWALRVGSAEDKAAVRGETQTDSYLPSPLLSQFILHLPTDQPTEVSLDAADFGLFYESLLSFGDRRISISCDDDFGATALLDGDLDSGPMLIGLRDADEGVRFWRRLANASIRNVEVRLGARKGLFSLGPDVRMDCPLLEVPAEMIRVFRSHGGVSLKSRLGYIGPLGSEPVIAVFDDGEFNVQWPEMRYPWVQYQASNHVGELWSPVDDNEIQANFQHLCRIVGFFLKVGSHVRKPLFGPATAVILTKYGVGGTGAANLLFTYMHQRGILTRGARGEVYFDPGPFTRRGIQLGDLHTRQLREESWSFLAEFLASGGASSHRYRR
jgi:hypothetical protein